MKRTWIVEALIIAGAVIGASLFIKFAIDGFVNKDRIVSVKGLAEVEVPANKVTWPIVFKEVGNDLPALYFKINKTTTQIKDYLQQHGDRKSVV